MVFPAYIFRLIINSIYYFCVYIIGWLILFYFFCIFLLSARIHMSNIVFMNMFMLA